MLTQTLQELQRDGYVHRKVFPAKTPGVEYSLTHLGRSMFEALRVLLQWVEDHHDAVTTACGIRRNQMLIPIHRVSNSDRVA